MKAEAKQMRLVDPILIELEQGAEITKRLLDIVPEDKLSWRPHPKAKSLGELAMHVACIPGSVAEISRLDTKEAGDFPSEPEATSLDQIKAAFAENLQKGKEIVGSTDD